MQVCFGNDQAISMCVFIVLVCGVCVLGGRVRVCVHACVRACVHTCVLKTCRAVSVLIVQLILK